ncbi:hypothetical protein BH23GEM9_BH23GEM9_21630 [soil metagenome]
MGELVHTLHWAVRYAVLAAGVGAVVAALLGWGRTQGDATGAERGLMAAFVGLVDLQVLLGLILLMVWPFHGALIGHIVMMVVAAAVAHAGSVMARRREPARSGARVRLAAVVLTLVLIVGGIMAIQRPVI